MRKVPISVMVLSIIGLVVGAINLLGLIAALVMKLIHFAPSSPAVDAVQNEMIYRVYTAVNLCVSIPLLALLVAGCIGSLMLRQWGRKCMSIYAWVSIVQLVVGTVYSLAYLIPKMSASIAATAPPAMRVSMSVGMYIGACGSILWLAFPICILYFYSRVHVVNAFNGIFPASPSHFPVEYPQQPEP